MRFFGVRLFLVLGALVCVTAASARQPYSPFGQSSFFFLNTNSIGFGDSDIVELTGASGGGDAPRPVVLLNVSPNPFNPLITIEFDVDRPTRVDIGIFDLAGRRVRVLSSRLFTAGRHSRRWDGRDDEGLSAPAGVYLVQVEAGAAAASRKITLVR